jgi:hypothetical protein
MKRGERGGMIKMTIRFVTVTAMAVVGLAFSSQLFAAVDEELVISDGNAAGMATITYDPTLGTPLVCVGGGCAALNITNIGGDHGNIEAVTKNFGGFDGYTIDITGEGGAGSILPELQNLDQINADRTVGGGGTLTTIFTDTDYTDFGASFSLSVSGTNGNGITSSKSSFEAYVSTANTIPASSLIGEFLNDTGASYNNSQSFANPQSSSGSLTAETVLSFSGEGTMQATFSIANAVPEPASIVFLGTMILSLTAVIRKKQLNRS